MTPFQRTLERAEALLVEVQLENQKLKEQLLNFRLCFDNEVVMDIGGVEIPVPELAANQINALQRKITELHDIIEAQLEEKYDMHLFWDQVHAVGYRAGYEACLAQHRDAA